MESARTGAPFAAHWHLARQAAVLAGGTESRWRSPPRRATEHETPSTQSAAVPGARSARGRSRMRPAITLIVREISHQARLLYPRPYP